MNLQLGCIQTSEADARPLNSMQTQLLNFECCVPFAGKRQALHYHGRVLGKVDRPTIL